MDKRDRWFFAVSLIIAVIPFSIMTLALAFLPDNVPLLIELIEIELPQVYEYVSKYRNLSIGFFCIIPVTVVCVAAYLKSKKIIDKNFYAVIIGSIVISIAFLSFVLNQLIVQARRVDVIRKFDFVGVISVCVSYILAIIGVFIYDLKPNMVLGFRNTYTLRSNGVWTAVHHHCSYTAICGFTLLAVGISFLRGLPALLCLMMGMVVYIVYTPLISRYYFKKMIINTTDY